MNPFDHAEYKNEDELSKAPNQEVAPSLPSAPQFLPISEKRPAQPVNGLPIGPPNVSLYPTYRDMPNSTNTATNTKQGQQIPTYAGYYQHQTVSAAQSVTSSVSAMHTQPQSTSAPSVPGVNTQAMSAMQCLQQFQYSHIPATASCGGAVSYPHPPPYPYPQQKVNQPNTTKQTQRTKSCQKRKQKHPTQHQVPQKRQHLQQTHNLSPYHPASSMQQTGVSQYQQFYQPQPVYPSGYSNQSQVLSYPVVGHNLQEGVLAPQSTVGSHPVQQQLYQQSQHYQASRQLQPSVMQQATVPGLAMQQQMPHRRRSGPSPSASPAIPSPVSPHHPTSPHHPASPYCSSVTPLQPVVISPSPIAAPSQSPIGGFPQQDILGIQQNIKPAKYKGESISCLHRHLVGVPTKYALVEALVKVFFKNVTTKEFVSAMKNCFGLTFEECTPSEELAFIQFYTLPTEHLKCSKIISIEAFDRYFQQMKFVFSHKELGEIMNNSNILALKQEMSGSGSQSKRHRIFDSIDLTDD